MMNKRLMKQIVLESYTEHGMIDEEKVNKIASLLKREDLKMYINALKYTEKKSTVFVDAPFVLDATNKKTLEDTFVDKKFVYTIDPSLLLGMRITNNDDVYDLSLKKRLHTIEQFLEENYD